jgi:outer membrane murein-binding lipoprotein Lpp
LKICVFGAGAIGGHVAARLAKGGADVSIIARGAQLAAIQERGLKVLAPDGEIHVHPRAAATAAELGHQDAVLVTTKQTALASVAGAIGPLLGAETSVSFIMNGVPWWYFDHEGSAREGTRLPLVDPGDLVRHAIGTERTIGGVVWSACTVIEPGVLIAVLRFVVRCVSEAKVERVKTDTAAIKVKTDQVTFTSANKVDATIQAAGDLAQAAADKVWNTTTRTLTSSGAIKKNTALSAFEFFMADSADHVTGKTGLTVTATRSLDGAAFAACANSVTEVSSGIYKLDLAAADLNGDVVTLKCTGSGADATLITIKTAP